MQDRAFFWELLLAMTASDSAALRGARGHVVLIGGGHSHVGVLRELALRPLPHGRLTLICNGVDAPYSGMLPGYVAGHYRFEDVHLDLPKLAAWAKADFICDEVVGIDRVHRQVLCRHHPPVPYELCSINTGAAPQMGAVSGADAHAIAVKPIPQFQAHWLRLLARVRQDTAPLPPLRIAVVGGGAGGVELCLALQYRLLNERKEWQRQGQHTAQGSASVQFQLFSRDAQLLRTHNPKVRDIFTRTLRQRGVQLHLNTEIVAVTHGQIQTATGECHAADEVMWVTQAGGAAWLRDTGLDLDAQGFVCVNDCLQSSDPAIFAAGDVASLRSRRLEKAGVFAVRMGPPLAENLRRQLAGLPLKPYRPQRHWLSLISTGDRYAVASRGAWGCEGAWVWRWKDHIDRRFMRRFSPP
ncbi:MAG: hypothetical protein RLZZ612_1478 [Pseudomonadota bacterium]